MKIGLKIDKYLIDQFDNLIGEFEILKQLIRNKTLDQDQIEISISEIDENIYNIMFYEDKK